MFSTRIFTLLILLLSFSNHTFSIESTNASLLEALSIAKKTTSSGSEKINKTNLIKQIKLIGNTHTDSNTILQQLTLKVGDPINPYKLRQNVKSIQSLGIFKEVKSNVEKSTNGSILTFKVSENPIVSKIEFLGNSIFDKDTLHALLNSKINEPLNLNDIRIDIQRIQNLYLDAGYIQSKVLKVDTPNSDQSPIKFHIAEGYIEDIQITGNIKTKNYVILREIDIEPGMAIQKSSLQETIAKISNLGYFSQVYPEFLPGKTPNTYILKFQLEEKENQGSLSFGGGFSPKSGVSIFSDLMWENLAGTGRSIMLKGNFGISTDSSTNRRSTYIFKYNDPWALGKRRSFMLNTWLTDGKMGAFNPYMGNLSSQNERRFGIESGIGWPLSYEFYTKHNLKYESVTLPDKEIYYNIYSYTLGLNHDTRDIRYNPLSGHFHTINLEQSLPFSHNALKYSKLNLTLRQFIPTFKKQTIGIKTQLGLLFSPDINDDEKFISEWYLMGGNSTIRGYDDYNPISSGPRMLLGNIEYRVHFNPQIQGVLFVDAGYATKGNVFKLDQFKVGKGIGIRMTIPPLGQIRLDLGVDENGESRIHFNMGHLF